jgi:hypothetical protein
VATLSPFPPPGDVPAEPPTAVDPSAAVPEQHVEPPRPGDLTRVWTVATVVMWVGVVIALAAVWSASRQLGLATWWLGPPAQPQPFVVTMLPFLAPTLMVAAAANRVRWLPAWGLLAAVVVAVVGAVDLGDRTSLAVTQLLVALAGAVFSVASSTGMYRRR